MPAGKPNNTYPFFFPDIKKNAILNIRLTAFFGIAFAIFSGIKAHSEGHHVLALSDLVIGLGLMIQLAYFQITRNIRVSAWWTSIMLGLFFLFMVRLLKQSLSLFLVLFLLQVP